VAAPDGMGAARTPIVKAQISIAVDTVLVRRFCREPGVFSASGVRD